ncbi:MAG TPA: sulfatase [Solirubrobacterales bacterium]|jgi:arylsulfatase A-like enzyme
MDGASPTLHWKPRAVALATVALAIALAGGFATGPAAERAQGQAGHAQRPNLIVITTDDQALNQWSPDVMPRTFARIAQGGTVATNAIAVPPLCCPARASLLTGSFPHNHGVVRNEYALLKGKRNTLPVWLRRAGYRTAFVGKFLNGYGRFSGGEPAPGFAEWWSLVRPQSRYWEYTASENGTPERYGLELEDYFTTQVNGRAVDLIEDAAQRAKPLFAWISHLAPHGTKHSEHRDPYCTSGPATLPGALDATPGGGPPLRERPVPRSRAYNEPDVGDKPRFIRKLPPITAEREARIDALVRCRWAALQEVDRGIEEIFDALERTGQLERTVVVLLTDNGTTSGEHRLTNEKWAPYEPAIRIPFVIWIPEEVLGRPPIDELRGLVGTIDVAPTLLQLAGASPCNARKCRRMDGVSLVSPLRGGDDLRGRRLLLQLYHVRCPTYRTVRTKRYHYTEWLRKVKGARPGRRCRVTEREFYDLRKDPAMLHNRLRGGAEGGRRVRRFERIAQRLATCSGIRGREPRGDEPFCG